MSDAPSASIAPFAFDDFANEPAEHDEIRVRDLGDRDVCCTIELGRLDCAEADLRSWQPGDFVNLPIPANGTVEIVAEERVVARGRLVNVDGYVGVEITESLMGTDQM